MRNDIPTEFKQDYSNGYEHSLQDIQRIGWKRSRNKYNRDYPNLHKFNTMGAYYYAEGRIDALYDKELDA